MAPRFSQVLLTDELWIQRCLARVPRSDFGLEWAPGKGALTEGLLDRWTYTLGLELDPGFCRILRGRFPARKLGVIRADAQQYPLPTRPSSYPLVGNLPYHVTGPLLEKLLRESSQLMEFQGLLQWEVARRITAEPGDSEYRSLSLLFRVFGEVSLLHRLPPEAFTPTPEVESGWIRFEPDDPPSTPDRLERLFRAARRCFRYPRKTLLNNLAEDTDQKPVWTEYFEQWGWDSRRRPHTLSVDDFKRVVSAWQSIESC